MACNLSFVVKNEGVLKVTGSHVYFKSVLKLVVDKYVETTVQKQVPTFNSSNYGCISRSFIDCKFLAREYNIYISRLCYDVSVRLSVRL